MSILISSEQDKYGDFVNIEKEDLIVLVCAESTCGTRFQKKGHDLISVKGQRTTHCPICHDIAGISGRFTKASEPWTKVICKI